MVTYFFLSLFMASELLRAFKLLRSLMLGGWWWLRVPVEPVRAGEALRPKAKSLISDMEFLNSLISRFRAAAFISVDVDDEEDEDDDEVMWCKRDFFSTRVVVLLLLTYKINQPNEKCQFSFGNFQNLHIGRIRKNNNNKSN